MKKYQTFVGIDISKKTFDAAIYAEGKNVSTLHQAFKQNLTGNSSFLIWLQDQNVVLRAIKMDDILKPNSSEVQFLTLAYNRFYDLYVEVMKDNFWYKTDWERFSKIKQAYAIYVELLN